MHFGSDLVPFLGIPRLAVDDRLVDGLELVDDRTFGIQISLLFGVQLIEVRLMLLIDDGRSRFETVPQVLTQLTCHRSYLRPLVVQLLQRTRCFNDVLVALQTLCRFTQQRLELQVLLEIQVTKFNIDLDEVVELLLVLLIRFAYLLRVSSGHRTNRFPRCLQLAHTLQISHHTICISTLRQLVHLVQDRLLACQVLCLLFGLSSCHLRTFSLVLRQQFFELLLYRIGCRSFFRFFTLHRLSILFVHRIELGLEVIYLVFDSRYILLEQRFELVDNLFSCVCHTYLNTKSATKVQQKNDIRKILINFFLLFSFALSCC